MKNYVVIGGSSGIGAAIVDELEKKGSEIVATYQTNSKTDRQHVRYIHCDVGNAIPDMEEFPEIIDGLVYCPGVINLTPFHRLKEDDFMDDYRVQVLRAVSIIRSLLDRLKKSEDASIVLFSTVAVQRGFTFHSLVSASKGAVEGLMRSLAAELAPAVRVNAVAPSLTDTNLSWKFLNTEEKRNRQAGNIPLKRIGTATEVAKAAVFLLTPQSSWVTGQVMHVDGGHSSLLG